jgi:hypothetical protein
LPSLNISADTSEDVDNNSNESDDNVFVDGNVQPYRFQPMFNTDSEPDEVDNVVGSDSEDDDNRRQNTDWYIINVYYYYL